jgi:hypothetical protein
MLVMGSPQFQTQDDYGIGDGIGSISQWQQSSLNHENTLGFRNLASLELDPELTDILSRLCYIFDLSGNVGEHSMTLSTTDLHDLTCYALHRLLSISIQQDLSSESLTRSEVVRYATSIYMFLIHGPTYYPHAAILYALVLQLKFFLERLQPPTSLFESSMHVWLLSIGLVGSLGTGENEWFLSQTSELSYSLNLQSWDDIKTHLESVAWLRTGPVELFHQMWGKLFASVLNVPEANITE